MCNEEKKDAYLYKQAQSLQIDKNTFLLVGHGNSGIFNPGNMTYAEIEKTILASGKQQILLLACEQGAGTWFRDYLYDYPQHLADVTGLPVLYSTNTVHIVEGVIFSLPIFDGAGFSPWHYAYPIRK